MKHRNTRPSQDRTDRTRTDSDHHGGKGDTTGVRIDHLIAESHKKHAKAIEYNVAAFNLRRNFPGVTGSGGACLRTRVSESALVTQIACLTRERM
jgi:hypothetical protein